MNEHHEQSGIWCNGCAEEWPCGVIRLRAQLVTWKQAYHAVADLAERESASVERVADLCSGGVYMSPSMILRAIAGPGC